MTSLLARRPRGHRGRRHRWRAPVVVATLFLLLVCAPSSGMLAQADPCPEPNDDPATACTLKGSVTVLALIDHPGDIDVYSVAVGTAGQVQVELTDLPADYDLYLTDANGGVLGQSVHEGTTPEQLQVTVSPGTYFVYVGADPERQIDSTHPYALQVRVPVAIAPIPSISESRSLVLADNFDDPASSVFRAFTNPTRLQTAFVDGEYSIRHLGKPGFTFGVTLDAPDDVTVAVDVRLIDPINGPYIHIGCRDQEPATLATNRPAYRFAVHPSSGDVVLTRAGQGAPITLARRRAPDIVRSGDQWNHLEFGCIRDTISARVNGQMLASVNDSTYHGGRWWIVVGGAVDRDPLAEARLDNLVVYGP